MQYQSLFRTAFAIVAIGVVATHVTFPSILEHSWVVVLTTIVLFFTALMSFRRSYLWWMSASEKIGHYVSILLFGFVYVFLFGLFQFVRLKDPLKLKLEGRTGMWTTRNPPKQELEDLRRMG